MAEYGDFCQWFSAIDFRVSRCAVVTDRCALCSVRRNLRINVRDHANPRDCAARRVPKRDTRIFCDSVKKETDRPSSRELDRSVKVSCENVRLLRYADDVELERLRRFVSRDAWRR